MEAKACNVVVHMNQVTHQPYSRRCHITARELRGLGFYLQEIIPDEAFVRRSAVGLDAKETVEDGLPTCRLILLEPFKVNHREMVYA